MVNKSAETRKLRLGRTPAPVRMLRSASISIINGRAKGIAVTLKLKIKLAI